MSDHLEIPKHIEHYRLEEKLGEGGMGVVYRAWDEDLERWVAVKFLHRDRRQSPSRRKRFRREALTVAQLVHPAIVQVHHKLRFEGGEAIVMELVEGQSLARLLAAGPLAPEVALPLLSEVAEGLAFAHEKGFVHRDLKADNVMVTRTGHAKVLDFGLAKTLTGASSTLSEEGHVLGTLHTMSPEQAQALEVDHRTDLFSLGVLLYESLTGSSPFRAPSARETLAKVVHHHPPPVSERCAAVPREISEWVDLLLAKDPSDRPESAEVCSALRRFAGSVSRASVEGLSADLAESAPGMEPTVGGMAPVDSPTPTTEKVSALQGETPSPRRRHRLLAGVVASLSLALLATLGVLFVSDRFERPVLGVADFDNLTGRGEMDWIGSAIAQSLTANLVADEQVRLPAGGRPDGPRASLASGDRRRQWEGYGADFLVTGSYELTDSAEKPTIELRFHLQDAKHGETLAQTVLQGREEEIFDLVRSAAVDLRRELGIGEMSEPARRESRALFPTRLETARLYSQALERLRHSDARAARELLESALGIEPSNPLLHDALARALTDLGYVVRMKEEARRAWELSSGLPLRQRLEFEARFHESRHAWAEVLRIRRDLAEAFPDEVEVGTKLAGTLIDDGRSDQALELLEGLRGRSSSVIEAALVDVERARAHLDLDDPEAALEIAEPAAVRSAAVEAAAVAARARFVQGGSLDQLGRFSEALEAFEHARSLFDQSGSQRGLLASATSIAVILADQGKLTEATERFDRYREISRQRGDTLTEALLSVNLANTWSDRGWLKEAQALLVSAVPTLQALEARAEAATALLNLGTVQQELGELVRAEASYEEAAAQLELLGDASKLAYLRVNLAEVLFWRGDLAAAEELLERALRFFEASGEQAWSAYGGFRRAGLLAARGLDDEAQRSYEEALEVARGLHAERDLAEIELGYARFELGRENFGAARDLAERAVESFRGVVDDKAALARVVLARTFLESGTPDPGRAQELYEEAEISSEDSENWQVAIELGLLEARIAAHRPGGAGEAAGRFEEVAAGAATRGLVPYVFEARLALADLEKMAGASVEARARLEGLVADARRRGFEAVAQKAEMFLGR